MSSNIIGTRKKYSEDKDSKIRSTNNAMNWNSGLIFWSICLFWRNFGWPIFIFFPFKDLYGINYTWRTPSPSLSNKYENPILRNPSKTDKIFDRSLYDFSSSGGPGTFFSLVRIRSVTIQVAIELMPELTYNQFIQ